MAMSAPDELLHVLEAHHPVVEGDPGVHLPELDVPDDVVDRLEQPLRGRRDEGLAGDVARQEGAGVGRPLDQGVAGLAVGGDGGGDDLAGLVLGQRGLGQRGGAALDGGAEGALGVGHAQRDVDDAVAVPGDVLAERGARDDGALDDEAGAAGLQHVRGRLAVPGLGAAVGGDPHAEGGRVPVRGLPGVADGEVQVVDGLDREGIRGHAPSVGVARGGGQGVPLSRCRAPPTAPRPTTTSRWAARRSRSRRPARR